MVHFGARYRYSLVLDKVWIDRVKEEKEILKLDVEYRVSGRGPPFDGSLSRVEPL